MITINETEFQRKCDEFVNREVYCNVSTMAEYILKKSWEDTEAPFNNDDIENQMQSTEIEWDGEWITFADLEDLNEWKEEMLDSIEIDRETELDAIAIEVENEPDEDPDEINSGFDALIDQLEEKCKDAEYTLDEYKEIFEYWVCSPWLIARLGEKNEAVIPQEQIWCRCTTGQSISIDGVIRDIVKEHILTDEEKENGE